MDIGDRLQNLFQRVFKNTELKISSSMTAEDIQGWDSMANIRLILEVEREFNIRISAIEVSSLKSISDLETIIIEKVN